MTPLVFGDVLGGKETFVRCGAHRAFPIVALEHFADSGRLWSVFWSALSRRLAGYPLSGALELGGVVRADLARNLRESRYINDLLFHAGALGLFESVPVEVFYLPHENMARDRVRIGNSTPIHGGSLRPDPTLVNYPFVLTPTNHSLQFKDRFCLVLAEI